MATLRDAQDLREADGEYAERMTLARTCRESAPDRVYAPWLWLDHIKACPLGEDCKALS